MTVKYRKRIIPKSVLISYKFYFQIVINLEHYPMSSEKLSRKQTAKF